MGLAKTIFWWAHQDSNLGQAGYEPEALPTELWARREKYNVNKTCGQDGIAIQEKSRCDKPILSRNSANLAGNSSALKNFFHSNGQAGGRAKTA